MASAVETGRLKHTRATGKKPQIQYAASDAAVAVDIFLHLIIKKMAATSNWKHNLRSQVNTFLVAHHEHHHNLPHQSGSPRTCRECPENQDASVEEEELVLQETILARPCRSEENDENHLTFQADNYILVDTRDCSLNQVLHDGSPSSSVDSHLENNRTQTEARTDERKTLPSQIFEHLTDEDKDQLGRFIKSICQGLADSGSVFETGRHGLAQPCTRRAHRTKTNAYSSRKRPLWDNCRLQAPDGVLLCTCDVRKAQWYLDKELGDKICEDPLTVRLRFEPSNRPESERNYYLQEKKNVCVVCGHDKDYVRKFIVPAEYRKYFPITLKDHSSHDVLLLCTPCHRKSCDADSMLRLQLAQECNAPLESGAASRTFLDHELQKVRSAGRALLTNKGSIPQQRVHELEQILKEFYGAHHVSEELIQQAAAVTATLSSNCYEPHGKKVVEFVSNHDGLLAFQSRWRLHFLDTMDPQFLPTFWSVDFVPESWGQQKLL